MKGTAVPTRNRPTGKDMHQAFQNWIAVLFLGAALVVGLWIFFGPQPEDRFTRIGVMFFAELPLFVILALIGMNALVRRGMGAKGRAKRSK